ncbi:hypothetical protein PAG33_20255, partial [Klebsiella quasipneumoniae]
MAHDVPLGCAPDEYDDLISGTCSHLPLLITLLISRLFHCAAKCRIIQQEYDTKTSKMFQSSHKMFQFVNMAELFFTPKWPGKYALIIKKII